MAKGRTASAEERGFLAAIKKNPKDAAARGAYADWLDEHDRHYEAVLQRGKAGLSEVYFKLRRKSDGLYSEGVSYRRARWSPKGKMWDKLASVRSHLQGTLYGQKYGGNTDWDDLEIVVIEVRVTVAAALPVAVKQFRRPYATKRIEVAEPLGDAGEQ